MNPQTSLPTTRLARQIPVNFINNPGAEEAVIPQITPIEVATKVASLMSTVLDQSPIGFNKVPPAVALDAVLVLAFGISNVLEGQGQQVNIPALELEENLIARLRAVAHDFDALEQRAELEAAGEPVPEELEEAINPGVELHPVV